MKVFIEKAVSTKGRVYLCLTVGETSTKSTIVSFDTLTILKVSHLSYDDLDNMKVGEVKEL